jgi:hypothetical protein
LKIEVVQPVSIKSKCFGDEEVEVEGKCEDVNALCKRFVVNWG